MCFAGGGCRPARGDWTLERAVGLVYLTINGDLCSTNSTTASSGEQPESLEKGVR